MLNIYFKFDNNESIEIYLIFHNFLKGYLITLLKQNVFLINQTLTYFEISV